jgi:hypothetical protein
VGGKRVQEEGPNYHDKLHLRNNLLRHVCKRQSYERVIVNESKCGERGTGQDEACN